MKDKVKALVPENIYNQLDSVITKYEIDTPLRLAHFLSQCSHESAGFTAFTENLNYSEAGLKKTFPKYFPGELAKKYARNPAKIASRVYANRMGNGNENSADGWKYRGRGCIQLTGKYNYSLFDKEVEDDILSVPVLVSTTYSLISAAWYWKANNLNKKADTGSTLDAVTMVTKAINGGTIGLGDRIKKFNTFYKALTTTYPS